MTQSHEIPPSPPTSHTPAEINADERSSAMLAHVLSMFIGFVGPAVIYYAKRRESRFVAFHAKQALIWHLALFVITFGGMAVFMLSMVVGGCAVRPPTPSPSPSPATLHPPFAFFAGFIVIWGFVMVSWLFSMGYAVYMAMQASSGRWARYPLVGRWVAVAAAAL